jgi:spermidine synthase
MNTRPGYGAAMAKPWITLASVATDEGPLELRQRDVDDFLIVVDGRVLMSSKAHRSEIEVASLACQRLEGIVAPRVLIGGLGMGYTLRAALDHCPPSATVCVAELNADVVGWCHGPLAPLTNDALSDPRVRVHVGDVASLIRKTSRSERWDAIILDLYEGPHAASQSSRDPFYSAGALDSTRAALSGRGIFSVWSEERDGRFERRLQKAGFEFEYVRSGRGGRRHPVYICRPGGRAARPPSSGRAPLQRSGRSKRAQVTKSKK